MRIALPLLISLLLAGCLSSSGGGGVRTVHDPACAEVPCPWTGDAPLAFLDRDGVEVEGVLSSEVDVVWAHRAASAWMVVSGRHHEGAGLPPNDARGFVPATGEVIDLNVTSDGQSSRLQTDGTNFTYKQRDFGSYPHIEVWYPEEGRRARFYPPDGYGSSPEAIEGPWILDVAGGETLRLDLLNHVTGERVNVYETPPRDFVHPNGTREGLSTYDLLPDGTVQYGVFWDGDAPDDQEVDVHQFHPDEGDSVLFRWSGTIDTLHGGRDRIVLLEYERLQARLYVWEPHAELHVIDVHGASLLASTARDGDVLYYHAHRDPALLVRYDLETREEVVVFDLGARDGFALGGLRDGVVHGRAFDLDAWLSNGQSSMVYLVQIEDAAVAS